MAKSLVPAEFKTHMIDQFIESITEPANTVYYSFIGDHVTDGSTLDEISAPIETTQKMNIGAFRNMIIGKKLDERDFNFVVNRNDWEAGTIFTMYDDTEVNLFEKNFYTVVDEDAFKHVYKCLYNNNGTPSTVKPLFQDARYDENLFVSGDDYYETNDGYQWKYLYSIDSTTFNKFATQKLIPITANTTIQSNSKPGAIDVIRVLDEGKNHNNYISADFSDNDFNRITPDIAENGALIASGQTLTSVAGEANVNQWYRVVGGRQIIDFYKNCIIYITSGVGAGQYRRILRSDVVTGVGVVIYVEDQFTTPLDNTSSYDIFPEVRIIGDGTETQKAFARAIVDSNASNSIIRVEMFDTGADYKFATAKIPPLISDEIDGEPITIIPSDLRAIIPPQGGHGANNIVELGASKMSIVANFSSSESDLVSAENTFSQFGVIRDPLFSNTQFYFTEATTEFIEGEDVIQFKKIKVEGTFTANSTQDDAKSLVLQSGSSSFDTFLTPGEQVYLQATTGTGKYLGTVGVGSNTTAIILQDSIPFIEPGGDYSISVFQTKELATCVVDNNAPPKPAGTPTNYTSFLGNKVVPKFKTGELIYGLTSRATGNVQSIDINSRIGTFSAQFQFEDFNQLFKIQGNVIQGVFQNDEQVFQLNAATGEETTGYIHSWNNDQLNLTRVVGDFVTAAAGQNAIITGRSSGATFASVVSGVNADILDLSYGDLDPNEGAVIYIQNDVPISRQQDQTEEIRVILEF
jgi:hypothetical protein